MYIKINLLPQEFRPRKKLIKFDVKLAVASLIVISGLCLSGYYVYQLHSFKQFSREKKELEKQLTQIQSLVNLQKEVVNLKKNVTDRWKIIKELAVGSDTRFAMLEHINNILPENLWLLNINESTRSNIVVYNIEGMSYSKDDISKFLAELEKFEKFSKVSLKSITPAPLEVRDAFQYVIEVELSGTQPPPAENNGKNTGKKAS